MTSVVAHRSPTKMMHNNMNKSAELKKRKRDDNVADTNNRKQKAHKTSPGQSGAHIYIRYNLMWPNIVLNN